MTNSRKRKAFEVNKLLTTKLSSPACAMEEVRKQEVNEVGDERHLMKKTEETCCWSTSQFLGQKDNF